MILSSPDSGTDALRLPATKKRAITCAGLRALLEKECRFDLNTVRIQVPGTVCRTKRNAIIFDLNNITTRKPIYTKK